MMADLFQDIVIADANAQPIALAELVTQARALADDYPGTVSSIFLAATEQILALGLPLVAMTLLDLRDEAVAPSAFDGAEWAWALNARGRAESALGHHTAAHQAYWQLRALGESLGDVAVISTAEQNLGALALLSGDSLTARHLLEASLATIASCKMIDCVAG